jgi:hypothetical protein
MNFDKKYMAGIAAVVIAGVYSIRRWRNGSESDDTDENSFDPDQPAPAGD